MLLSSSTVASFSCPLITILPATWLMVLPIFLRVRVITTSWLLREKQKETDPSLVP